MRLQFVFATLVMLSLAWIGKVISQEEPPNPSANTSPVTSPGFDVGTGSTSGGTENPPSISYNSPSIGTDFSFSISFNLGDVYRACKPRTSTYPSMMNPPPPAYMEQLLSRIDIGGSAGEGGSSFSLSCAIYNKDGWIWSR